MVWKIWFWIYLILICILSLYGAITATNINNMGAIQLITGLLTMLLWTVTLGYFYALGWKKKLFSKKLSTITNIFIILAVLAFIASSSVVGVLALEKDPLTTASPIIFIVTAIFCILFIFVLTNIPVLPIYFAMFKYKTKYETFDDIKKPCWKIFASFVVFTVFIFLSKFFIFNFYDITKYNIWDYLRIPYSLLITLSIIGLSWDKKIFNQIFWKIIAISYIPICILAQIYGSFLFKTNFGRMTNTPYYTIFEICLLILYTYIVFKYAFSKEIFIEDTSFEQEISQ